MPRICVHGILNKRCGWMMILQEDVTLSSNQIRFIIIHVTDLCTVTTKKKVDAKDIWTWFSR